MIELRAGIAVPAATSAGRNVCAPPGTLLAAAGATPF
jgi:hypothetical protein